MASAGAAHSLKVGPECLAQAEDPAEVTVKTAQRDTAWVEEPAGWSLKPRIFVRKT